MGRNILFILLLKCTLTKRCFTVRSEKWFYPFETMEIVWSNISVLNSLEFSIWKKPFLTVLKWIAICAWLHTIC